MKPANFIEEVLTGGYQPRTLTELSLWESLFRNDLYVLYADAEKITPVLNAENLVAEERHGTTYVIAFTSREAMAGFNGEVANGGEWHWETGKIIFRALKRKKFGILLNQGLEIEQEVPPELISEILEFNNRPQIATMDALLAWLRTQNLQFLRHEGVAEVNPSTKAPVYDEEGFFVHEGVRVAELDAELDFYELARNAEIVSPLELSSAAGSIESRASKQVIYSRGKAPLPPMQQVEVEPEEEPKEEVVEEAVVEEETPPPTVSWEKYRRLGIAGVSTGILVLALLLGIKLLEPDPVQRLRKDSQRVAREATQAVATESHRIFAPYFSKRANLLRQLANEYEPKYAWKIANEAERWERLSQLAGSIEASPVLRDSAGVSPNELHGQAQAMARHAESALALLREFEASDEDTRLAMRAWTEKRTAFDIAAEAFFQNAMLSAMAFRASAEPQVAEHTRRRDRFTARAFLEEAHTAQAHMAALIRGD